MKSRPIFSVVVHVLMLLISVLGCIYRVFTNNDYSYFAVRTFFSYYVLIEPILAGTVLALISVLRNTLSNRFRTLFYVSYLSIPFIYLCTKYHINGTLYTAIYKERLLFVEVAFVIVLFVDATFYAIKSKIFHHNRNKP